ncbi:hypothetical protein [Acidithiobacillus ferrooxidans]|uniref:hypothetical protein n=1 Tax=Acidithiobacillus ferrooxidans TaxID=920 RepID=UPI0013D5A1D0|nr:hypothetical protein [Acidithiobacillus ferrooxidans]
MSYTATAEASLLIEADLYIKDAAYRRVIDLDAAFGDEYAHAVIAVAIGLAEDAGQAMRTQP